MADSIEQITAPNTPEPPGNIYSQCLKVGERLYLAGQTGNGPDGNIVSTDPYEQTRACFTNIKNLIEAAGGTMADIVKLTVYLVDMAHRPEMGRARGEFFQGRMPCSTLLGVQALATPDYLVEVDAEVILGAGS